MVDAINILGNILQGRKPTVQDAVRIGQDGIQIGGKPILQQGNQAAYVLRVGEASPLAGNVEQFMKANGMPVTENGTISAIEMSNFKKKLDEVAKSSPEITKHVTLDREGNLLFTKKGLEMLDIQAPGAVQQQAPGQQQAPQQQAPQQQPSGSAPATQVPSAVQGAGNAISGAVGGAVGGVGNFLRGAAEAARGLADNATKCNNDKHPDFNTQACADVRAKQANPSQER